MFIYIRETLNYCRINATHNLELLHNTSKIYEPVSGTFYKVFKSESPKLDLEYIHNICKKFHLNNDFYDSNAKQVDIVLQPLTNQEIQDLLNPKLIESEKIQNYMPRQYQEEIIQKSLDYFKKYRKGILLLICGMGKTLISLWITQRLQHNNSILIGVPNLTLLMQWQEKCKIVFPDHNIIICNAGMHYKTLKEFYKNKFILLVTYASSKKVRQANISFDVKILDECHHLTCKNIDIKVTAQKYVQICKV